MDNGPPAAGATVAYRSGRRVFHAGQGDPGDQPAVISSVMQADSAAELHYQRLDRRQSQSAAGADVARYAVEALEHAPQFLLRQPGPWSQTSIWVSASVVAARSSTRPPVGL